MTYLAVNPDKSIIDITDTDETGSGIEIQLDPNIDDLAEVKMNRYGHSVFDYINGAIVLNSARQSAVEFPEVVGAKIAEIKDAAVSRMQAKIPGIRDIDTVNLTREFWLSLAPAARTPTADFQFVIDVYIAATTAIGAIKALADAAAVQGYDVINDPAWPG